MSRPEQALRDALDWFKKEKTVTPDKVAEGMGYRMVESRMFQARITALKNFGVYVEAEIEGITPEEKLENLRSKIAILGVVLDEAAIPYLEAGEDKTIATILNTYQISRGLLMEYITKSRAILKLRGSENEAYHLPSLDNMETFSPIGRFVDKSSLVDFLIGFVERNVFPRWLQIKNISFKAKHIKPDWIAGGMTMPPGKERQLTTMQAPRSFEAASSPFPYQPQGPPPSQSWQPPAGGLQDLAEKEKDQNE